MEQAPKNPKHIKSFWAITIIAVIAVIAGGLIYWFQFNYTYDEEVNSLELRIQRRAQGQQDQATKTLPQK